MRDIKQGVKETENTSSKKQDGRNKVILRDSLQLQMRRAGARTWRLQLQMHRVKVELSLQLQVLIVWCREREFTVADAQE